MILWAGDYWSPFVVQKAEAGGGGWEECHLPTWMQPESGKLRLTPHTTLHLNPCLPFSSVLRLSHSGPWGEGGWVFACPASLPLVTIKAPLPIHPQISGVLGLLVTEFSTLLDGLIFWRFSFSHPPNATQLDHIELLPPASIIGSGRTVCSRLECKF